MKQRITPLATFITTTALGATTAAFAQGPSADTPPPPPKVTYVELAPKDLPEQYERLGVVEPSRSADVYARIEGFLSERLFEEGQIVEAGQVLYRIERDTYEAEQMVRSADLQDAEARLELAKRDYHRTLNLSKTGAVAQEQLDEAEIEQDRATAAVARAKAALREADIDLGYTEVVAPITGIIGKATRDKGDLVDNASNSLLTNITCLSPIYVTYGISEVDYRQLQKNGDLGKTENLQYQVIFKNGDVFEETGKLNYKSPQFEASTGMLRIRVQFPNKEHQLLPNQFVKIIEDHGTRSDILTIPKQSVIQSPMGPAVFVIDKENILQFRPVQVADWQDSEWEIASGLEPGERIMVEGLLKSKPGTPVTPEQYNPQSTE